MKALQTIVFTFLLSVAPVAFAVDALTQLLTEAQTAYLRGETDLAKAKFQSVMQLDPKNKTAIGYLKNIKAKEEQAGVGASQEKQLAKLIIPNVQFKEATLSSALDYLKQSVSKLTDGKQAVNFVVQLPEEQAKTPITLNLTNVPFTEVLKYVGGLSNSSFTYDRYAITVRPNATAQATAPKEPGQ